LRVHRSRALNDFIDAKVLALLEVVLVVTVVKAVANFLRTLAEFISTPSMEF
jgi:hypothetical protein